MRLSNILVKTARNKDGRSKCKCADSHPSKY